MITSVAVQTNLANPFPGLRPFRDDEEHLFFGRESQVDSMVDKLAISRFLAVVGTSGSGKSSLVNCGLKPALRRGLLARAGTDWRMVQFRPGSGPIKALACALAQPGILFDDPGDHGPPLGEMIETNLLLGDLGLVDVYRQASFEPGTKLLVVVDQFEELFRFRSLHATADEDRATAFVNLLLQAVRSDYPIYVVMTMRSDFLGDCAQFEALPEAINRGEYLVPRMTRDERKRAITGPVQVGAGRISPVLLTRLLNDVGDNPDQLSIMQHALNRTWARWQREDGGADRMSLEHYEAIGTMLHALDQHAEKAFAELPDERAQTICKKIFQALTDKGSDARGVRRPTRLSELCAIAKASPGELTAVMEVFRKPSRSFLMPPAGEKLDSDSVVDISHESLMRVWKRLRDWVDEETESAAQYIRLVENATRQSKGEAGLMTDPELSLMLDWKKRWNPNAAWAKRYHPDFETAMMFLEGSRIARDAIMLAEQHGRKQELKRARLAAAVFGVLFLLAVATAIYAFTQRSGRLEAEQHEQDQKKLTEAKVQLYNAEKKAAEESEKHAVELDNQLKQTEEARRQEALAKERAQAAEAQVRKNADAFMEAMQAQAAAERAATRALEARATLQRDSDAAKRDPVKIDQDRRAVDEALAQSEKASGIAAQTRGKAFEIMGGVTSLGTDHESASDLFEGAQAACESGTTACQAMFAGPKGGPVSATVFSDDKGTGFAHSVSWRTARTVDVKSVGLHAAHLADFQRAFTTFTLFAIQQGHPVQIAEYSPSLPYGGECGKQPCLPPKIKPSGKQVLSVCINVSKTVPAQEYRAEFVQAISSLEGLAGPMVLQLDGYSKPNCAK